FDDFKLTLVSQDPSFSSQSFVLSCNLMWIYAPCIPLVPYRNRGINHSISPPEPAGLQGHQRCCRGPIAVPPIGQPRCRQFWLLLSLFGGHTSTPEIWWFCANHGCVLFSSTACCKKMQLYRRNPPHQGQLNWIVAHSHRMVLLG